MSTPVASIFSLLLVVTGAAKLRRPNETARAIGHFGTPFALPLTLLLGGSEIVVGAIALISGQRTWLLIQAGLYAVFLGWVLMALRMDAPLATCGCLGRDDTPPYWGHVILNSFAVVGSLAAAMVGVPVAVSGMATIANLAIIVVGAGLAFALLDQGARAYGLTDG